MIRVTTRDPKKENFGTKIKDVINIGKRKKTLVQPQRIFLERPSRNATEFQEQQTSFKEFQGLARTTENLQGKPKNSTIPLFSHFQLL